MPSPAFLSDETDYGTSWIRPQPKILVRLDFVWRDAQGSSMNKGEAYEKGSHLS